MSERPGPAADRASTHRDQAEIEFSRIVAFSDGVFAIAITLLVLALEIPQTEDLGQALRERDNELFAYALSFAVLGKLWLAHHRFFSAVARFDNRLMGLNIFISPGSRWCRSPPRSSATTRASPRR